MTQALWREILGPSADPTRSFLDNGGDSFHAVLLSTRLYEITGAEVDYLDVLTSDDLSALSALADERTTA
ncbi:phosphopantetheine-binding protein [Streptomyces sp. NPDC048192]|uniref:phosphopantetheine-binding protein n=1 Tax=Streptomyces sp. NPDC048192 TaxID=3365510 RepID=UPI003719C897